LLLHDRSSVAFIAGSQAECALTSQGVLWGVDWWRYLGCCCWLRTAFNARWRPGSARQGLKERVAQSHQRGELVRFRRGWSVSGRASAAWSRWRRPTAIWRWFTRPCGWAGHHPSRRCGDGGTHDVSNHAASQKSVPLFSIHVTQNPLWWHVRSPISRISRDRHRCIQTRVWLLCCLAIAPCAAVLASNHPQCRLSLRCAFARDPPRSDVYYSVSRIIHHRGFAVRWCGVVKSARLRLWPLRNPHASPRLQRRQAGPWRGVQRRRRRPVPRTASHCESGSWWSPSPAIPPFARSGGGSNWRSTLTCSLDGRSCAQLTMMRCSGCKASWRKPGRVSGARVRRWRRGRRTSRSICGQSGTAPLCASPSDYLCPVGTVGTYWRKQCHGCSKPPGCRSASRGGPSSGAQLSPSPPPMCMGTAAMQRLRKRRPTRLRAVRVADLDGRATAPHAPDVKEWSSRRVRGGDHSGLRGGRHSERVVELAPVPSGPGRGGSSPAGDQTWYRSLQPPPWHAAGSVSTCCDGAVMPVRIPGTSTAHGCRGVYGLHHTTPLLVQWRSNA